MKKKIKDGAAVVLKRLVYPTSVIYTVITLALYIAGSFIGKGKIPTLRTVLLVLAFSFVISLAGMILAAKRLHLALRVAIHYAMLASSFFGLFFLAADFDPSRGLSIISFFAFTLIYASVCATVFAVRGHAKKSRADRAEYKSIYDKNI